MAVVAAVVAAAGCAAPGGTGSAVRNGGAASIVTTETEPPAPVLSTSVANVGSATTTSTVDVAAVRSALNRWPSVQEVVLDGTALVIRTSLSATGGQAEAMAICTIANAATQSTEVRSLAVRAAGGETIARRPQNDTECRN